MYPVGTPWIAPIAAALRVVLLSPAISTRAAEAPVDPRCWADEFSGQQEACCADASAGADLGCWGGRFLYENCCLGVGFWDFSRGCFLSKSQFGEEDLVVEFFGWREKTAGVYVEIGAFDGITFSNTLSLHSCLSWSGVLIEGSPQNFERLRRNLASTRPRNVVAHFGAVCAPPESNLTFLTGQQDGLAEHGAADGDVEQFEHLKHLSRLKGGHSTATVPCKPMSWYLQSLPSNHVDFFSLDVEGSELEVLLTMDFREVTVEVFMIELLERSESDQQRNWKVRNLMANLGYKECQHAKVRHSGLFVRQQGPFSSKC
ncbi:S [Symbiodinium natans]|uniref:S protein n=1 Tax=Symbiodinium natans TaxID=878477 RepID=A0A812VA94_9DINO|nr:S [Symbiodinium natans] [Symbiodinium natans]